MNNVFEYKDENGFTIQETLVALVVSFIVISFGFSTVLFVKQVYLSWKVKSELRERIGMVLQRIAYDVQHSDELIKVNDSCLVLKQRMGKIISYDFSNERVCRNDVVIVSENDGGILVRTTFSESSRNIINRSLHISAEGTWKAIRFNARVNAAIPWSSHEEFHASKMAKF